MSVKPAILWNDTLERCQPHIIHLAWKITAAVTVSKQLEGQPTLEAFGAIASQAVIDAFLGTTSEFDYLAFDATALNADVMGVILDMKGQCRKVLWMTAACYSGTDLVDSVFRGDHESSTLTASTLDTEVAVGANGNVAFKVDFGNSPDFDNLTAGLILVELAMYLK